MFQLIRLFLFKWYSTPPLYPIDIFFEDVKVIIYRKDSNSDFTKIGNTRAPVTKYSSVMPDLFNFSQKITRLILRYFFVSGGTEGK
jgi:hypothetical protein